MFVTFWWSLHVGAAAAPTAAAFLCTSVNANQDLDGATLVARRVGVVSAGYWPWGIIPWRVICTRGGGTNRCSTDRSSTDAHRHGRTYTTVIATPVDTPTVYAAAVDTATSDATAIIC
jgi:hypothetical protein